ncbi:MAG: helix-turn-helix domain-containing protein [Spirochaetaceae bacterium]|nr:helix-turn-helix domain-containing protein [Spirochaetaceae bacterium]
MVKIAARVGAAIGGNRFTIPYDRQELADYLSVDRSVLSRVPGALRDEGLLSFRKNLFTVKGAPVFPGRRGFPGTQS